MVTNQKQRPADSQDRDLSLPASHPHISFFIFSCILNYRMFYVNRLMVFSALHCGWSLGFSATVPVHPGTFNLNGLCDHSLLMEASQREHICISLQTLFLFFFTLPCLAPAPFGHRWSPPPPLSRCREGVGKQEPSTRLQRMNLMKAFPISMWSIFLSPWKKTGFDTFHLVPQGVSYKGCTAHALLLISVCGSETVSSP